MKNHHLFAFALAAFSLISATTPAPDLEVRSLLDDKIELKVPIDFNVMSEELLQVKYPASNRPTLVYSNETGGINVAFNHTPNQANQEAIASIEQNLVQVFKTNFPTAEWKDHGTKEINGRQVGYLEMITPALDTDIYNLLFFTDVEGKLLICTFNCTIEHLNSWESTAHEIMSSLQVNES